MSSLVVTGTDTDVGKTVFAAALVQALGCQYWKPVQAGLPERDEFETDSEIVRRLVGMGTVYPEAYRLALALSPHHAADLEGETIDVDTLELPKTKTVIEGAGGLMVPLTRTTLYIDVFARWGLPLVLCARTSLGTINHTLLSVEAIRARKIPLLGIAFIGDEVWEGESESIIIEKTGAKRLGRLPHVDPLNRDTLAAAFAANFNLADFA
jgi:dethiobiotin synthetase